MPLSPPQDVGAKRTVDRAEAEQWADIAQHEMQRDDWWRISTRGLGAACIDRGCSGRGGQSLGSRADLALAVPLILMGVSFFVCPTHAFGAAA